MTRKRIVAAGLILAFTACGGSGHTRNPSDEHPDDMSGEPRNLPPEGPPGQTIPIREPTNSMDTPPAPVGGATSTIGTGSTGGSPASMQ